MRDATLLACVFWYRRAYNITRRNLFHDGIAALVMIAWTLYSQVRVLAQSGSSPRVHAYLEVRTRARSKSLLDLTDVQQFVALHKPAQLAYQRNMLAHVPAEPAELRVLLHKALHVADRVDGVRALGERARLVRLHVVLQRRAEVAERREVVREEERVRRRRQRDLLHRRVSRRGTREAAGEYAPSALRSRRARG